LGLRERLANSFQTKPDPYRPPSFGALSGFDTALPTGPGGVSFSPGVVDLIRLGDSFSSLGEVYRSQWAVRTCVNFLAQNMAHLRLKTYRRGGETDREPASDSPLQALLDAPNAQTSRFDFMRDTVSDLCVYMNSFWWKAQTGGQRRLVRLPVTLVEPKEGSVVSGVGWYELTTSAGPKRFETNEIVHIRGYNPLDPRVGSPILYALKSILAEELAASQHRRGFWRNAARRDGIILRPKDSGPWSDDARERFRSDWQNAHSGADNAGKAPILEDGMTWDADSFSPRDSEFIQGRQFGLDTVATAYQIPLAMLSRTSTPTFASMKEFRTVLYVDVLGTWSAMIESALTLQLVPDFDDPDLYVEFNIEEKLQGDFEEQANAARNSVQVPWMSVNEMRAKRGQAPVGDPNDEENPYNSPARPANYNYAGDAPPQAPVAPVTLAPAARNGHSDVDWARILEESHDG
jgi:HK97 family phage portal protein